MKKKQRIEEEEEEALLIDFALGDAMAIWWCLQRIQP